jgi:hypothetical protein
MATALLKSTLIFVAGHIALATVVVILFTGE